jgi:hypothetical protein
MVVINRFGQLSLEDMVEPEEPLDISWPKTMNKRITYVLLFPITILLYITLPDVRRPVILILVFFSLLFVVELDTSVRHSFAQTTSDPIIITS